MPLTITINEAAPGTLTIGVGPPGVGVPAGGTAGQVLTKVNSTDYNTVFATPSADYITAVTAPLSVTSGNLSVNLSTYLPLAGGTMDANATVELSDSVTGTVSEVGGYGFAVSSASNVNLYSNVLFDRVTVVGAVGATTLKPTGVEFPDLTLQTSAGISAATAAATYQTLAGMSSYLTTSTAASTYYLQTNPAQYQTVGDLSSALQAYLTTSTAASTYYPLVGNPSGFLTSAPVTSVAGMTGAVVLANTDISGLGTMSTATAADYSTTVAADGLYYPLSGNPSAFLTDAPSDGSTYGRNNGAWAVAGGGFITSVTSPLSVTSNDLSVDLSAYLTTSSAASTYYLQTNPDQYQTLGDLSTALSAYLTTSTAASTYYLQTNPSNFLSDAPSDGTLYGRQNAYWAAVLPDAPSDGTTYGRNNGAWVSTTVNPPYSNSVWTSGGYVSATVTNIYDTGSSAYYNVLTF